MGCLLIGCIGLYTIDTNVGREASHGSHQESFNVVNETSNGDNITRIRMFEGSTEWLVATLVSFLGVLVNVLVVKVGFHIDLFTLLIHYVVGSSINSTRKNVVTKNF